MGRVRSWSGVLIAGLLLGVLVAPTGPCACSRSREADPETRRQVRDLWGKAAILNQANMDHGFSAANAEQALGYLRVAEGLADDDPALLAEIGRGYFYLDRLADAERLLHRALDAGELDPSSEGGVIAREIMGRILMRRGDLAHAEALIKQAAAGVDALNRRDPDKYFGCPFQALGALYSDVGRLDEAARLFQRAADAESPKGSPQYEAALGLLAAGDVAAAGRYARRAWAIYRLQADGERARWLVRALQVLTQLRRAAGADRAQPSPVLKGIVSLFVRMAAVVSLRARGAGPLFGDGTGARPARVTGDLGTRSALSREGAGATCGKNGASTQPVENTTDGLLELPDGAMVPEHSPVGRQALTARIQRVADLLVEDLLGNDVATVSDVADTLLAIPDTLLPIDNRDRLRLLAAYASLVRQDYDRATTEFEELAADEATRGGARVGRGHLAIVRHDPATAEGLLVPALVAGDARFGDGLTRDGAKGFDWLVYRMACLGLAWSAANQNRHELALSYYDRILTVRPDDVFALLGEGNSLSGLARMDEAEALFRRVLAQDPENPFALAELGLVAYNRGDIDGAEASFKQALVRDNSRYTCPYEGLGLVYLRQGRLTEARQNFEKSIAINPDIEYKKYNGLAKIYLKEGKTREAVRLLRKSMANYPYDDEARKLLSTLPPELTRDPDDTPR